MGAFEDMANSLINDAIEGMKAQMEGKPYESITKDWPEDKWNTYLVLEDFVYHHDDQDVSHGTYRFKKGEHIKLREDKDSRFLPDMTKLRRIR